MTSRFNVVFPVGKTYAVWNSLTGCFAELSETEYHALRYGQAEDIEPWRREAFEEKGILISEPDEMGRFLESRHIHRQLHPLHFRILTTTACNARCEYCYERGFPIINMDDSTALSVAEFIAERYRAHPFGGKVTLEWFGGEPSLNAGSIQLISEVLKQKKIPFRSHMTSNGLLLTKAFTANAPVWNLKSIQITLDAAEQEYEQIKHFPRGSYEQVLKNIDSCLSVGIHVSIRINYAGNKESVRRLIENLAGRYSPKRDRPKLYISPIYDAAKSIPGEVMREIMELNELLIGQGLMAFDEVYTLSSRDRCFAATPWGFTVLPDGKLVNCSHNISGEQVCGSVWDFDPLNEKFRSFRSAELVEECYTCALLPVCGGGCPAAQHGIAKMHRCIPYRNVITDILRLRMKNSGLI